MSDALYQQVVIDAWPQGEPKESDFRVEEKPLRDLEDGEALVRVTYLSLDPYMRGMMAPVEQYEGSGYIPKLGDRLVGEAVGIVEQSRRDDLAVGDFVVSYFGWCSHAIIEVDAAFTKIDPTRVPEQCFLGAAGMPGRTAYFGLLRKGKIKPGETVVVSAAAGAVGSVVGQIAKINDCRVVGIAGPPEKCRHVVEDLGFDACVSYKDDEFEKRLAEACPDGVDVYFENVGGRVLDAVIPLLNDGARVPVCGYIALYNEDRDHRAPTPLEVLGALDPPVEHGFFLVDEWNEEREAAVDQLIDWIHEGRVQYRETVAHGLAAAPEAFIGLLRGRNLGKQLVKLS